MTLMTILHTHYRHTPRRRSIQYAASSRFNHGLHGILDHPPSRMMTNVGVLATRCARVLQIHLPPKERGRREDRVRAAPAVSCAKVAKKSAHEHTGSAEAFRPSLRNGFTAYIVLSPARPGLLVTVARVIQNIIANLTPAIGASGPHDFAVRLTRCSSKARLRPPLPAPTSVTMANAPSLGTGWQRISK